ncbi:hypothetical protein GCM10018771_25160 [Streptomyces cellulosae]|nr:hypothetical protein GCM10018771_25160 [Streptomyces cellulosae]
MSGVRSFTGDRSGLYAAYDTRPVTNRIVMPASSTTPSTEVNQVPRSGLRQKSGEKGPRGRRPGREDRAMCRR